jgi:hypothetical protein
LESRARVLSNENVAEGTLSEAKGSPGAGAGGILYTIKPDPVLSFLPYN